MKKSTISMMVHSVLSLYFLLFSLHAFATDINVPAGTNVLQGKVTNANAGDVLILAPGNHFISTSVIVNKKMTIRGAGSASTFIIKSNGATLDIAGIVINANAVTMNNFTLDGKALGGPGLLVFSDNNTLSNIIVKNCGNNTVRTGGIIFDASNFNTITSVKANNNRMVGLSQNKSAGNSFNSCTANDNGAEGLTIDLGSDNCRVTGCTFLNNNVNNGGVGGIGIDSVNGAWVKNSTISGTKNGKSGITFQNNKGGEDGCIITGNTITNNTGYGILVRNCVKLFTNNTVLPNSFSGNTSTPNIKYECPQPPSFSLSDQPQTEILVSANISEVKSLIPYPNPSSGSVYINYVHRTNQNIYVDISNEVGRIVESQSLGARPGIMEIKVNVTDLNAGVYFARIKEGTSFETIKFMVIH